MSKTVAELEREVVEAAVEHCRCLGEPIDKDTHYSRLHGAVRALRTKHQPHRAAVLMQMARREGGCFTDWDHVSEEGKQIWRARLAMILAAPPEPEESK